MTREDEIDAEKARQAPDRAKQAAIVVNPTKFEDIDSVREVITAVCGRHGWGEPIWIETSEDDPGTGQAHQAVAEGAELVCPLGGDGTVRAVAAGLIEHDVPMGLLPGGTGNLMARNLDLPVDNLEDALTIALTGQDRAVDVGFCNVVVPDDTQDNAKDYYFLVMAGIGFDADVMAGMDEQLKKKMGWAAYVVSGLKNVNGARFGTSLAFDGHAKHHRRIRSLIVGNCGKLQLGVELLPDARVDDGKLDAMLTSPKGVIGWAGVVGSILTHNHRGHRRVEHVTFEKGVVRLDSPQELQLDGDSLGPAIMVTFGVRPHALTVRVG